MIDGIEKRNRQLAFELQNSHVCEKRSKSMLTAFFTNIQKPPSQLRFSRTRITRITCYIIRVELNSFH